MFLLLFQILNFFVMVYKLMHFQKLTLLICLTVMNIQKKKKISSEEVGHSQSKVILLLLLLRKFNYYIFHVYLETEKKHCKLRRLRHYPPFDYRNRKMTKVVRKGSMIS
jgi:hypothetical protein